MPAIPMKEAALKYSPDMAEAFHPTLDRSASDEKIVGRLRSSRCPKTHPDGDSDSKSAKGEDVGI